MNTTKAVASVIFARQNKKIYVLSAQRVNSRNWNKKIMFGAAGKTKPEEKIDKAMEREIQEEFGLRKPEIIKITRIGEQKPKTAAHENFSALFYTVEVPFETLKRLVFAINKNPQIFPEHRNARINKIRTLGKKPKLLQPHYNSVLGRIKKRLQMERKTRIA